MTSDFIVSFPGLGIEGLHINRQAFSLFGQSVYWYGLLIAAAIIICLLLSSKSASRYGLSADDIMDTFIVLIPMIIIFARLYYVVFEWQYYSKNLSQIFNTRQGGLAFYGGVIGGILTFLAVAWFKKIAPALLIDFLAVYVPLGQAIGRWGNFFNQEAFGSNTTLPWGMISNETFRYLSSLDGTYDPLMPVHPTFLYEFLGNMLIFALLLYLRKRVKTPLVLTFTYLGSYGLLRFFVESVRTDALYISNSNIRVSMLLSAILVLLSAAYLIFARKNSELLQQRLRPARQGLSSQTDDFIEIEDDDDIELKDIDFIETEDVDLESNKNSDEDSKEKDLTVRDSDSAAAAGADSDSEAATTGKEVED